MKKRNEKKEENRKKYIMGKSVLKKLHCLPVELRTDCNIIKTIYIGLLHELDPAYRSEHYTPSRSPTSSDCNSIVQKQSLHAMTTWNNRIFYNLMWQFMIEKLNLLEGTFLQTEMRCCPVLLCICCHLYRSLPPQLCQSLLCPSTCYLWTALFGVY